MERIVIGDHIVEVPREIVAEGRAAVAHWLAEQLAAEEPQPRRRKATEDG